MTPKILLATSTASPYTCMEHMYMYIHLTQVENRVLLISATQVFRNACKVGSLAWVFIPAVSHYTVDIFRTTIWGVHSVASIHVSCNLFHWLCRGEREGTEQSGFHLRVGGAFVPPWDLTLPHTNLTFPKLYFAPPPPLPECLDKH